MSRPFGGYFDIQLSQMCISGMEFADDIVWFGIRV